LRKKTNPARTPPDVVAGWLTNARLGPLPQPEQQRRARNRWEWDQHLWVFLGTQHFRARSVDLSAHGMGLLIPEKLAPGTPVDIADDPSATRVPAVVIHAHGPDDKRMYHTGVRFQLGARDTVKPADKGRWR
jgi:hypothetical protein